MTPDELKQELRELPAKLTRPIATGILVAVIFGAYLVFLGIPKSQARNMYNLAIDEIKSGSIMDGAELLEMAYDIFPEEYIRKELEMVKDLIP